MVWIRVGSLFLFLGVLLGAFGAHRLSTVLSEDARHVYQTAVFYHVVHGLALLAVGWLTTLKPTELMVRTAGWAFVIGILLFSGSLYGLSVTGVKKLGTITPLGGLAFLIGWGCMALAAR